VRAKLLKNNVKNGLLILKSARSERTPLWFIGQVSPTAERWRISDCRTIFDKIFSLLNDVFTSTFMTMKQK
jgi:hypothetical protein